MHGDYGTQTVITPDSMTGEEPEGRYNGIYVVKVRNK